MRWLERRFGLVLLASGGLSAYFGAEGVTSLALSMLVPEGASTGSFGPKARGSSPLPFHSESADPVLMRNPFDSTAAASTWGEEASPPLCERIRAVALAMSADADWSLAELAVDGEPASVLRRRGGEVAGLQVAYVGRDRVTMTQGNRTCEVVLFSGRRAASGPEPPRLPAHPSVAGVVQIGANEFTVDRALVERVLSDQAELMQFGQVVPERDSEGRTLGIRLVNVRTDTLPAALGLASGDRLQAINGYSMTDPERMLEAFAHLREAPRLRLELVRGGRPMTLDYSIR